MENKDFRYLLLIERYCHDFRFKKDIQQYTKIWLLCPSDLHEGRGEEILSKRHDLYELAGKQHPERWNGRATRDWTLPEAVYLNPEQASETDSAPGEKTA